MMGLRLTPANRIPMKKKLVQTEFALEKIESEESDLETPLQPYEILSYPADFTLEVLVDKWTKGEISANFCLQRRTGKAFDRGWPSANPFDCLLFLRLVWREK